MNLEELQRVSQRYVDMNMTVLSQIHCSHIGSQFKIEMYGRNGHKVITSFNEKSTTIFTLTMHLDEMKKRIEGADEPIQAMLASIISRCHMKHAVSFNYAPKSHEYFIQLNGVTVARFAAMSTTPLEVLRILTKIDEDLKNEDAGVPIAVSNEQVRRRDGGVLSSLPGGEESAEGASDSTDVNRVGV